LIKQKPIQVYYQFKQASLGSIGISSITLAELQFGVQKSNDPAKNQAALDYFLVPLDILNFNIQATLAYGEIRADLEQKGTPIGFLDTLIAAHAKARDLTLVTNNEKEFSRIEGLQIENWIKV